MWHWALCLLFWVGFGRDIAIEFHSSTNYEEFAKTFGLTYKGSLGLLDHIHLFHLNSSNYFVEELARKGPQKRHVSLEKVKWFEEQIPKKREKRLTEELTILDPLFPSQWHLHGSPKTHLNVQPAWTLGYLGKGIRIAIVDDGIQSTHPDVQPNVRVESSWNFNRNIQSPDPTYMRGSGGDWHGTASAGAAAGRNDGVYCGVGVAPHAELAGIAILQNNAEVGDAVEAQALSFMPQRNHIYSNSWGPIRPGTANHANEKPGPLLQAAIEKTISTGRGGLGSIYVWAAGNDGVFHDNCNYDGYASMRYAILVGSTDHVGQPSSYSEPCSAMLAVAPGGLISSNKIITTDLLGDDGLERGRDCTSYSGTSASCPLAAGVMALALEAHPNATWLELQYIIVESSSKHNDHPSWKQNAAGFWHSNNMGFGLLDAHRIVRTALRWKENNIKVEEVILTHTMEDRADFVDIPENHFVHHVEIDLYAPTPVSDTFLSITSPAGTVSVLATPHDDRLSHWNGWTFLSRSFHGESSQGRWSIQIHNKGQPTKPSKWVLRIYASKRQTQLEQNISTTVSGTGERGLPLQKPVDPENQNDLLMYVFLPSVLLIVLLIKKMTQQKSNSTTPQEPTTATV
jgi:hypothetical protein